MTSTQENTLESLLTFALRILSFYFLCVATAHLFGLKIPLLYVYFDVPSTGYQDRIISFMAMGWCLSFYAASKNVSTNQSLIKMLILAGAFAVAALANNNYVTDFTIHTSTPSLWAYWLQTGLLAIIVAGLYGLYRACFK